MVKDATSSDNNCDNSFSMETPFATKSDDVPVIEVAENYSEKPDESQCDNK